MTSLTLALNLHWIAGLALQAESAAPPAAAEGPRVGDVCVAGAEATWVIEAASERIGEHWWSYDGTVELPGATEATHHFHGGVRVMQPTALGPVDVRTTGELWTDEHGHPLRFAMRTDVGGTRSAIEVGFVDGHATGFTQSGPSRRALAVDVPRGAYLLANNWIGALELITQLAPPTPAASSKVSLFVADIAQVVPFELKNVGHFTSRGLGSREGKVVEGDKYRDSLGEILKMEGRTLFELEIVAASVRIRRSDEPIEKFTLEAIAPPRADLLREEVVVEHGGDVPVRLAGTLTRTKKGTTGPLPAVFFVSGSGLQDREGVSGGIDLGTHELLDRLTDAGFLVLRVDDRGAGGSTGPLADLDFDGLIADARACVDFLLAREDVDAKHVFVIGHSEGGETAPILACERPLAGIVLMAAPGRSLFEILREQKQQALEAAGLPKATVDAELVEHARALELLTREGEADPSQLRADYRGEWPNRAWYRSHARRDAIAQVKLVKCPVLIVQGALDLQVSAQRDVPPLEKALREARNPDVTVKVLPGLDHLFKKVAGAKPSFQEYFTEREVDHDFLDLVAMWLEERTKR